jgi:circadian clock protein KaiC
MLEGNVIKTGIKGLDEIFLSGIPRGNVILLQGVTGSGKTLLGIETVYRGIVEFN